MAPLLKNAVWNANGSCQYAQEIKLFLEILHLHILLVSETHFTERSYMNIPNNNLYHTTHPVETAHRSTAIIIRRNLKHHVRAEYKQANIKASSISVKDNIGETTVSAIYCLPKHKNKYKDYD